MKCPKCETELNYLLNYQSGEKKWEFSLDEKGNVDYDEQEFIPDGSVNDFECPECNEVVATNETEAKALLEHEEETDDSNIRDHDDYLQDEADRMKEEEDAHLQEMEDEERESLRVRV